MATPFAGVQASSVYRHKVGAFEITVLSDGNLALEATLFSGDQARAEKLLEAALLPKVGANTFDAPVSTRISFSPVLMSHSLTAVGMPTLGKNAASSSFSARA